MPRKVRCPGCGSMIVPWAKFDHYAFVPTASCSNGVTLAVAKELYDYAAQIEASYHIDGFDDEAEGNFPTEGFQ